ncbi:syndecan-4 [Clinocottus analis]|uniref:syndecan-4 n=1 Tax=Clinocottus analis TaxID=304258 RepID=UPI0035BF9A95
MLNICLVLLLAASVLSESVRETETWVPMRTTQAAAMSARPEHPEASGDSANGSDFGFTDDDDDDAKNDYGDEEDDYYPDDTQYDEDDEDDDDDDEEFSGSGDGATALPSVPALQPSVQPEVEDNKIPGAGRRPARPTSNEPDPVQDRNDIPPLAKGAEPADEHPSNVLMSHASDDSVFNKTEVLAALIAGGAVGLMFAVLLILLLIYRMKKKDEGSYDLGKKPIYKKAPTTEIYA